MRLQFIHGLQSFLYTRVNMEDRWKGQAPLFMNCFGDSLTEGFGLRKGRYWLEIATREMASGSGILDPAAPCHQISFKRQNFFLREPEVRMKFSSWAEPMICCAE